MNKGAYMQHESQPTNEELMSALQTAHNFPETIPKLRALRDKRSTWFGTDEGDLRYALDEFLRPKPLIKDDYPW